jgi:hypothetical protein
MERERNETKLIELGTASTDTRGPLIVGAPEPSGYRFQGLLAD